MAERTSDPVPVSRLHRRALVALRVEQRAVDQARRRLGLAEPLTATDAEPRSLWLGPEHWLLVGERMTPVALVEHCAAALTGVVHLAVDQTAALAGWRLGGPGARELLAGGTGLDLRADRFGAGSCTRTRLAQIAAIVVATGPEQLEIYVERAYAAYFDRWLADANAIAARAMRR